MHVQFTRDPRDASATARRLSISAWHAVRRARPTRCCCLTNLQSRKAGLDDGHSLMNMSPGEVDARTVELLDAAYRFAAEPRVVRIDELESN